MTTSKTPTVTLDRRGFLTACSRAGITSALLPGILYTLAAQAQEASPGEKAADWAKITPEMLDQAAALAGVGPFTAEHKKMMLDGLSQQREGYEQIRALKMPNSVAPAFVFHPQAAPMKSQQTCERSRSGWVPIPSGAAPASSTIWPSPQSTSLRVCSNARKITSLALTQMFLNASSGYDPKLHLSSPSPKSAQSPRQKRRTRRLPPVNIADRCTAFPGARRICWQ